MQINSESHVILGLDVSTACIGVSIIEDNPEYSKPQIISITHKTPKIPGKIKGIESLCLKKNLFDNEFLNKIDEYTDKKITNVVIEEPLLSSNNAYTVAELLRFNGMIAEGVYNILGIVPNFISSYDARTFSFPELLSVRKHNKKGEQYQLSHILNDIKNNHLVLFGAYPFDVDKKTVMMDMVNSYYTGEEAIPWEINKKGNIAKENYDACDSLICALAFINVNKYGISKPTIKDYSVNQLADRTIIRYTSLMWDKEYNKVIELTKGGR